jgi:hypothetical protein
MDALPEAVRLGLYTLRQALCAKGVPMETPLQEALWDLAHDKPGDSMDVGESLTCAALWVQENLELEEKEVMEPIGFTVPYTEPEED